MGIELQKIAKISIKVLLALIKAPKVFLVNLFLPIGRKLQQVWDLAI